MNKGKNLFHSTATVSSMTLLSRIAGFLRDMVTAQIFGAGAAFDAFSVAFRIPNLMRRLFAEGSFSQAFVPVLAEYQQQNSGDQLRGFISAITGTLGVVLAVVTLLGILAAPLFVHLFAPGFTGGRFELATSLLRITFPYLFLVSLTALSGAILNTFSRFWVPAFTPIWLNLCMIAAAIWLGPHLQVPIMALAIGVFVAGVLQLGFQLPFLRRMNLLPSPRIRFRDPGVRRVLKLMVPALFGVSVSQLNLLLDTLFASILMVGSVSWLYYSDRLMEFPLGVIGVAISTVILPHLSRHHVDRSTQNFSLVIDWALRCILLAGIPAGVIFAVSAGPLISTLFQHGHFDGFAVTMTQKSLTMFAIGITPFMAVKVLAAGFYARQNIRTPVRIGILAMVSNMVLNAILVWPLKHAGIALATSLSAVLNAGLLFWFLKKNAHYLPRPGWGYFSLRLLLANGVLGVFLWLSGGSLADDWIAADVFTRIEHLAVMLVSAGLLYLGTLWLTGMRPRHVMVVLEGV